VQQVRADRVAIYIRWSTDDQGDGTTAQVQLEGCRHYVLSQGWQVRPDLVFVDDGYSGGDLNRPALGGLRQAVADGQIDCVVVFKIDRLSRNVVDTVNLVLREWEGRAYVKSAREPIDTTSPAGKMFFYTLVSFAEWERSVIRERTLSGKLRRLQEGKNPGFRPPYGLAVGAAPGAFALVPAEAEVVRQVFLAFLAGETPAAVAGGLQRRGVTFRGGRPFTARAVTAILANPIYAGRLVYGRRMANPRKHAGGARQVKNPAAPLVVEQTNVPPIIDPSTYAAARRLAGEAGAARPGRSGSSAHLLTGLLRCRCGAAMVGVGSPAGPYYVCAGTRGGGAGSGGAARCDAGHVRQDQVDRWLVSLVLARLGTTLKERRPDDRRSLQLPQLWATLDRPAQKRLLRQFVASLTVYRAPRSPKVEYDLQWIGAAP
jgi:site-specific DNA recombinase